MPIIQLYFTLVFIEKICNNLRSIHNLFSLPMVANHKFKHNLKRVKAV